MGVSFYQGTFTKTSGNGSQSVTGLPFQPKAVIFWTAVASTAGTITDGMQLCYGFSDGTTSAGAGMAAEDNIADSDGLSATYTSGACIVGITANADATDAFGEVTSLNSDGFTINWTSSAATTPLIHYIMIGGTDITNVKVGGQTIAKSTTGNKSYTGVGFQPDFLLTVNNGYVKASTVTSGEFPAHAGLGISAMKSTSARWATSNVVEGGRANSDSWRYHRTDKCFTLLDNSTGTVTGEADFVSFDSDGFTWNYTTTGTNITNSLFAYLAIKGGVWDVGSQAAPTSNTTTVTNTSATGTLKGFGSAFVGLTSSDTVSSSIAIYSVGGSDGTRQSTIGVSDLDAASTMANVRVQSTSFVNYGLTAHATAGSSTVFDTGSSVSFSTSSFTTTWTNAAGFAAYLMHYFALSELASTLYERGITESTISVSDSNTRLLTATRAISESSISVSDSNTRVKTISRVINESSISVSDSLARLLIASRVLSESSISVSDSLARLLIAQRSINESSISVSDALARVLIAYRTISENSISVSDTGSDGHFLTSRSIEEDPISVSDALARILYANRTISESSISVNDSLARLLTAIRSINEPTITVSDAGSDGHFLASRSIEEDPISVSDSLARILYANRSITEDEIDVTDDLVRTIIRVRSISEDPIDVLDSLARTIIRVRSIDEDTISVSDDLARLLTAVRTIDEDVDVTDDLARILTAYRSISESSISVLDSLARSTILTRSISESTISVSDALARMLIATRAISESSISVSDALARIKTQIRDLPESVSVSDSLARMLNAFRTISESAISVSDSLARPALFIRTRTESGISVSDSLEIDETKQANIIEPAIIVSDSLVRKINAFRTISEPSISVSDLIVGQKPIPILAEYITDPGYTNPVRFRITWKSKLGDTLADESGDQIIYYRYDSFVPEDRPFDIIDFSIKLTQGEISTASLTINDFRERIDDPRKIGKKSIVEVEFKKELGREWQRILTGIVREVKHLRPAHAALMYSIIVKSKQAIYKERIMNFRRAARRSSVDSTDALTTDSNMLTNKLFKEIHTATDIYPRRNSPTLEQTGEFDMDTGSVSEDVTDFVTEIAPGLTTAEDTINQLTEGMGSIWGVDEFGNPYLRYPTEKHSGIVLKDDPLDSDSATNTSVIMASFEFTDTNDVVEGFANRLYVLNSKDTQVKASSNQASGFTTLTTRWIAQSFIIDDNNVTAAAFILSKTGNPTNTTGTIKGVLRASSVSGTFPTGATLATFEISLSSLSNAKDTIFVNDIKTKEGVIVPGQRYWWVLQGTGLFDDTHTVRWHHDNDLATAGRFWSAVGPQVDTDPTKPGLQFNWVRSETGPVYAFSTFSSINHILVHSDPESIKENGLIEAVVNLPAFNDDATYQKVLVKILRTSAKTKRIYEMSRVTIPTAKLFKPGELITVIDSKSKLSSEKVINAEIVEVSYNFDVNANALGCKYCDLRLIGFVDEVTDNYLSTKEC